MTRSTPSLDLSWNSEDSIIYFGKLAMVLLDDDEAYNREVTGAIFHQLVDMERELSDLRAWKRRTDEWIKSRPAAGT